MPSGTGVFMPSIQKRSPASVRWMRGARSRYAASM
jgi:hypothetical protein